MPILDIHAYESVGKRALVWHPTCKHYVWLSWALNNRALASRVAVTVTDCRGTALAFRSLSVGT